MKSLFVILAMLAAQAAQAGNFAQETQEAQQLVQNSDIYASYHYCVQGKLTCRTLVLLKDKKTGAIKPDFYDVFLSSERAVGSTGYFLEKNNGGKFKAFLDDVFDGQIGITVSYPENHNLTINFDSNHMPTIRHMILKRLGTTKYIDADMSYNLDEATIVGTEYDSADPNYSAPVRIIYLRANP